MRRLVMPFVTACLLAGSAAAQETPPDGDPADIEQGVDLLSEGARTLLRGLMGQVDPAMRGLAEQFREWNFEGLTVEDLGKYHPPEMLPNGDIIIRRKSPLDEDHPLDGEVDI